jgi:hypothetical protein
VKIPEQHFGQHVIDPAAQTELSLLLQQCGFTLVDDNSDSKPDIEITGEAFSEYGMRKGNLKAAAPASKSRRGPRERRHPRVDRQTSVAVDMAEHIAAKTALQNGAGELAERLLPKREGELSLSGLVRANGAVRVGKLLRADWFLMGSGAMVQGTNSIVVRIIDTREGTMRDIALLPLQKEPARLAADLAKFVRQSRASASSAKPRTYLSIGDFDDLSMNSHQAAFGEQLRANLTAALHANTNLTVLERDGVGALLQEMRLDLAGLTDEQTANPQELVQSAVWTVDGFYQAYEQQGQDVELALHICPAFGRSHETILRGAPGEGLFHLAQQAVEKTVAEAPKAVFAPSRSREIKEETKVMLEGTSYMRGMVTGSLIGPNRYNWYSQYENGTEAQKRHRRQEGQQAAQRVLLLDPTNQTAMLYLAVYLQDPLINRAEEAQKYFQEAADFPVDNKLKAIAMGDLAESYALSDHAEAVRLLQLAREHFKTNADLLSILNASELNHSIPAAAVEEDNSPDRVRQLAEQRLFAQLQDNQDKWIKQQSWGSPDGLVGAYARTFGKDDSAGLNDYGELLPTLKQKYPATAPYLVASTFARQTNSINPFTTEFEQMVAWCSEHPDTVIYPDGFFDYVCNYCYWWCLDHKQNELAARLIEARGRERATVARLGLSISDLASSSVARSNLVAQSTLGTPRTNMLAPLATVVTNAATVLLSARDRINLARCYYRMGRAGDALEIIDSIAERPTPSDNSMYPWEPLTIPGTTNEARAFFRHQLGLPPIADDRLLILGDPCLRLESPFAFSTDSQGIWVAAGPSLIRLDFNAVTNDIIPMPNRDGANVTVICEGADRLWVGTDGNGIIEFDQATHKRLRRWTEQDGLYSGHISRLCLDKDTLWIGFSFQGRGALGRLDLASGSARAFAPTMRPEMDRAIVYGIHLSFYAQPPGEAITGLAMGQPGELYVATTWQVLRYRIKEDKWDDVENIKNNGLACDGLHLFINQAERVRNVKPLHLSAEVNGVAVLTLSDGHWDQFGQSSGLPMADSTATAFGGKDVWVGGKGYIGVLDLENKNVRKRGYMQANAVDHLEVAGGFLWAQFGGDLYRIPLSVAN